MRDFSISVDIKATPERVWQVLSDGERWAEWTPSVTSVEMLDDSLAVGSRAMIRQPRLPPALFKITALDPGKSFTWASGIRGIVYVHARHSVEPAPLGARATLALRFDGLLGGLMGRKMAELNHQYLRMEAAGLKRFSEEGPRDPNVPLEKWSIDAQRAINRTARRTKEENLRVLAQRGETADDMIIRDATEADIPELAKLHVVTWNACYNVTNGPSVAIREWQWRKQFAEQDGTWFCVLVTRKNGELIAFAKGKRSDHPGFDAELNKIYLLPEYQRVGIGTRLLRVVVQRFLGMGLSSMWLIGEADNPSTAFHEAMGGYNRPNDDATMNYGNFFWDDLKALARRLETI